MQAKDYQDMQSSAKPNRQSGLFDKAVGRPPYTSKHKSGRRRRGKHREYGSLKLKMNIFIDKINAYGIIQSVPGSGYRLK